MNTTFKIQVSETIIHQASALFNASLEDIFTELLQNSRRAGATSVHISLETIEEQELLCIEDNGIGMFDQGVNITLGGSQWSDDIQDNEYPAGMGLFSLANRGCTITANNLSVTLELEHFNGEKWVEVTENAYEGGTRIYFPLMAHEKQLIEQKLLDCGKHYPLPVYWREEKLFTSNFMEDAVYVEQWEGLEIGLFHYGTTCINFYGLVIPATLPTLKNCLVDEWYQDLCVHINVVQCPKLRLTLPRRRQVVQNRFFEQLQEQSWPVLYRYLQCLNHHYLTFDHYRKAQDAGITIPPAYSQLTEYSPQTADDVVANNSNAIVALDKEQTYWLVDFDAIPAMEQVFYDCFTKVHTDITLVNVNDRMEGYEWYDSLPKIKDVSILVSFDNGSYQLADVPQKYWDKRPNSISIAINVTGDGQNKPHTFPLNVALWDVEMGACYDDPSCLNVFIPKDSEITVPEVVELMFNSFFVYYDDPDADSYDTQAEYFRNEAEFKVMQVLGQMEEGVQNRIKNYVEQNLLWLVGQGKQCVITISNQELGKPHTVDIKVQ